jgi:hypothetical protein
METPPAVLIAPPIPTPPVTVNAPVMLLVLGVVPVISNVSSDELILRAVEFKIVTLSRVTFLRVPDVAFSRVNVPAEGLVFPIIVLFIEDISIII